MPTKTPVRSNGIQIAEIDSAVVKRLVSREKTEYFSERFGGASNVATAKVEALLEPGVAMPAAATALKPGAVNPGDVIQVSLWEAPPALLFGVAQASARSDAASPSTTVFPEQMIGSEGHISVPFAGKIRAAGRTLVEIEAEIVRRLTGKANQPQVLVRLLRNNTANVTVVGEVAASTRMPLTPQGERVIDALAAAGGVRQPVNKMTLQLTRGDQVAAMPLDLLIRDPRQNIVLQPGDVLTALFQPLSFTALGATGKNEEVAFEAQGISLAQALARVGGLQDARADARGVFVFRFETRDALTSLDPTTLQTPDGRVPVIYRLDMKDAAAFFMAQNFPVRDKDVLYVSNAPAAELQKFLNILTSSIFSVSSLVSVAR